jgi:hypothetical protein
MVVDADDLCEALLNADSTIRFVGIANKMGRLVGAKFRKGLRPLLTSEELKSHAMKATLRMRTREDYESRLGKVIYTFALYGKVKRASILLNDDHFSLLLVAFDVTANHESIILKKLLPKIKQQGFIAET